MTNSIPSEPEFTYASNEVGIVGQHLIRLIERFTGQRTVKRLYDEYRVRRRPPEMFWADAIEILQLDIFCNKTPESIFPATGPLIVLANHPFGVVDGLILSWLVSQVRGDYKIMTHHLLHQAPEAKKYIIPIDFSETKQALATNIKSRKDSQQLLADGGALIIFPSGSVALTEKYRFAGEAKESDWKTYTAKLALSVDAPVVPVYFSGQNSRLFQIFGNVNQALKYSLLFHEVVNKIGRGIRVSIGDTISAEEIRKIGDRRAITDHLKAATESLRHTATGHFRLR